MSTFPSIVQMTGVLRDVVAMRDCKSRMDYRQLVRQLSQNTPILSTSLEHRSREVPDHVLACQLRDCAQILDRQLPIFVKASRVHVTGSKIESEQVDFSEALRGMTFALGQCRKLVDQVYPASGGIAYSVIREGLSNLNPASQN